MVSSFCFVLFCGLLIEKYNAQLRSQIKGEEHMSEYTYETYGMAKFYVLEGMYSIAELEQMLSDFKEAKLRQDAALEAAMKPTKEKNG